MTVREVPCAPSSRVDVAQPSKVVAFPVDADVEGIPIGLISCPGHIPSHQLSVEWGLDGSIKEPELCKNHSVHTSKHESIMFFSSGLETPLSVPSNATQLP